jgi:hypothetical protein
MLGYHLHRVALKEDTSVPTTTAPIDVDLDVLRGAIREEYAAVTDEPTRGFHFHTGRPLTRIVGYESE